MMKVFILGNYRPDRQQSMLRYGDFLFDQLQVNGLRVSRIEIPKFFGAGSKWWGYFDKMVVFPALFLVRYLLSLLREGKFILHLVDHSNAFYLNLIPRDRTVVTCHDVGAIRGAMGEVPDCPATTLGRLLQRWILRGLLRASRIAFVSESARNEFRKVLDFYRIQDWSEHRGVVILNPLNQELTPSDVPSCAVVPQGRYLLHVGSNLKRKNRLMLLKILKQSAADDLFVVFAGEGMDDELREKAEEMDLLGRVIEVISPDSATLGWLYRHAWVMIFPSRFEGFGWPIIEAQSCGCPVVVSNVSSVPEVAGDAAIFCSPDDLGAHVEALGKLEDPDFREELIARGYQNVKRFDRTKWVQSYCELYKNLEVVE